MRVFKFGGASVKDAKGVQNVLKVLQQVGHKKTLIVVSAMGKTTNALELVVQHYFEQSNELNAAVQEVKKYHNQIILELFEDENHPVFKALAAWFEELNYFLNHNKSPNYSFVYDQVVSFGELISTTIMSHYFNMMQLENKWLDVRNYIKTDTTYRDAQVNWELTQKEISTHIEKKNLYITQGFLGSDPNHFTTTLGREGSDYTAAIFAYCLNAESVTIWKDVPGVLNADPRYFENPILLNQISYREAIELAFYGATVIHPKTLQPLQRKEIPLYVKSFMNPLLPGTAVSKGADLEPETACFIIKKDQILLSLSSIDFSFIMEEHISEIFALLHFHQVKMSLIQNSAISFSVCIEDKYRKLDLLTSKLAQKFQVTCTPQVSLYTIRHFTPEALKSVDNDPRVLVKQILGQTLQVVLKA
jgi:aspartate kinase